MRALSVKQPWAWAIVTGRKDVENRSRPHPWTSAVGEVVALHSSATIDKRARRDLVDRRYARALGFGDDPRVACGAVLATMRISNVHEAFTGCCDPLYAETEGWHVEWDDLRPLVVPIPCKGALGLWQVPELVERGIAFQLTTMEDARVDGEVLDMVSAATGCDYGDEPGLFDYDADKDRSGVDGGGTGA